MERANLWRKAEPVLFLLFVLYTAMPVLAHPFFPTVDGPAHLHNANLLKQYLFYGETSILNFFDVNTHLNSNFVDHLWFAVFGLFLPTHLVEKTILLFYVLALPYSFRYLVNNITANKVSGRIASYLILPFVYSFTFRIGFFNFCIGIPLVFWTLGYWIQHRGQMTVTKTIWLAFLATITYASHLFNFMLLGIILFTNEFQYIIRSGTLKGVINKIKAPVLIFLPGLLLSGIFFFSNSSYEHAPPTFLPFSKLTETITDLSPVITLSYEREILFARTHGCALLVLLLLCIYDFFKNRNKREQFHPKWIFSALIVLVLFYVFPDCIASGGFISIRWALFFFLVLIILIASKELRPAWLILPIAVMLINHIFFIQYHDKETAVLSADAETLANAEKHMETNSVLLPLNYSTNWIHINHANYMATQKNIVNLDNYEPTKPHFPLIWKKGEQVYDLMQKYGNRNPPCINIPGYESKTGHRIDYLSRFCFDGNTSDSCNLIVEEEIKAKFELIHQSENRRLLLYKRKPNT
ncbi:MAG TPA: hypothetical protein VF868_02930 [Bacteroidia bacterium]|jgi:hypothetical protein